MISACMHALLFPGQTTCTDGFPSLSGLSGSEFPGNSDVVETQIIPGMRFTCSGTLTSWTVAGQTNPSGEYPRLKIFQVINDQYKFIDEIELGKCGSQVAVRNPSGYYTCELPEGTRTISVQPSYIIGFICQFYLYLRLRSTLSQRPVLNLSMSMEAMYHLVCLFLMGCRL